MVNYVKKNLNMTAVRIAIVAYESVLASALFGLRELFQAAERFRQPTDAEIDCRYVSAGSELLSAKDDCWQDDERVDVVILPPCTAGVNPIIPDSLRHWLIQQHRSGAVLASACVGACLLAQTGLLDGRIVTTHWLLSDYFRQHFPAVILNLDAVVIEEPDLITAGGMMAWLDLGLRIIRRYYGSGLVSQLNHYLVWDGGDREQRYYRRFQPPKQHGDAVIEKIQIWLEAHFQQSVQLAELATQAAMSERTLQRRFLQATRLTCTQYIQLLRIEKARELLEITRLPIEQIIWQTGYEDRASFNKLFKKQTGLSPLQYRQRFGSAFSGGNQLL